MIKIERRQFLTLAAAAAGLSACGGVGAGRGAAFVLVHGALHGGWCWRRVARLLQAAGAEVFAPTLTGLGERAHFNSPKIGLSTHIADVVNCIVAEELQRVVLVGHSYAGMVITGAAQHVFKRISHLVYLDAVVPRDGENALDAMGGLSLDPRIQMFGTQAKTTFGVSDPEDLAWLRRRLGRQSAQTLRERISITRDLSTLKRTYIACTAERGSGSDIDKMEQFTLARLDKTWRRRELASGHDAMITAARPLADMLIEIAGS